MLDTIIRKQTQLT